MKYILFTFLIACVTPKLSNPRNAREAHIYKYTDIAVEAEINGKGDSARYYLNLALKYDSVRQPVSLLEYKDDPVHIGYFEYHTGMDTVPWFAEAHERYAFEEFESTREYYISYRTSKGKTLYWFHMALKKDTLRISPGGGDSLFSKAKVIIVAGKTFRISE